MDNRIGTGMSSLAVTPGRLLLALLALAPTPLALQAQVPSQPPVQQAPNLSQPSADSMMQARGEDVLTRVRRYTTSDIRAARMLADSLVTALPPASPLVPEALFSRASIAANAADAERDYSRIITDHRFAARVPDALMRLAVLENARNDRAAALRHLDRLLRDHGDSPARARASLLAGRLRMEANDPARGCELLAAAHASAGPTELDVKDQAESLGGRCPTPVATMAQRDPAPMGVLRAPREVTPAPAAPPRRAAAPTRRGGAAPAAVAAAQPPAPPLPVVVRRDTSRVRDVPPAVPVSIAAPVAAAQVPRIARTTSPPAAAPATPAPVVATATASEPVANPPSAAVAQPVRTAPATAPVTTAPSTAPISAPRTPAPTSPPVAPPTTPRTAAPTSPPVAPPTTPRTAAVTTTVNTTVSVPPVAASPATASPATASPTTAPPITSRPATASPTGDATSAARYGVQFAAYNDRPGAEEFAATLRGRGIAARVEGTVAPFRVRAGRYATRIEAEAQAALWRRPGQAAIVVTYGPTP